MTLAIAFDEARKRQIAIEGDPENGTYGHLVLTPFFGARDDKTIPHADFVESAPGWVSKTHFHAIDQFQLSIKGRGKIGRQDFTACSVHFSRAYTPYGPLVVDADTGVSYFNLHALNELHWGSHHLPQAAETLKKVSDRQPWQSASNAVFPTLQSGAAVVDMMISEIPGIKDDYGLAGYTLSVRSHAEAYAPDPSDGAGQYVAVVKGSVLHRDKELKAPALIFIYPEEGAYRVHAGATGLDAIILNFPRPQAWRKDASTGEAVSSGFKTWRCALCAFIYDEAAGLPEDGIKPGTRWQDVPESWICPDCSTPKADFQMIEVES